MGGGAVDYAGNGKEATTTNWNTHREANHSGADRCRHDSAGSRRCHQRQPHDLELLGSRHDHANAIALPANPAGHQEKLALQSGFAYGFTNNPRLLGRFDLQR